MNAETNPYIYGKILGRFSFLGMEYGVLSWENYVLAWFLNNIIGNMK